VDSGGGAWQHGPLDGSCHSAAHQAVKPVIVEARAIRRVRRTAGDAAASAERPSAFAQCLRLSRLVTALSKRQALDRATVAEMVGHRGEEQVRRQGQVTTDE